MEPPWGLQWPQGCCCGQDPTTSWLKSQLLFSRKTSPLGGQAHVFSVCTQGRDLELGVCSSSCKDTSPAESKAFDYVDHNKLWKILKEIGIPDHLTCLLRNLYAGHKSVLTYKLL